MMPTMQTHVRSKVMWIPLILVGALLYWSLALGLGGMSLSFLGGSCEEELALEPATITEEPIVVQPVGSMSEWRGTGGNQASDDGTGRLPGTDSTGIDEAFVYDRALAEQPAPPPQDSIGRTAY